MTGFVLACYIWCSNMRDEHARNIVSKDEHAPDEFRWLSFPMMILKFISIFRILGSTSNFVEFDRAFGCKPDQGNS